MFAAFLIHLFTTNIMRIFINYLLRKENTFGIEATAAAFVKARSTDALKALLIRNRLPIYLLGGGSNILFTQSHYDGLFIKNAFLGIKIVGNSGDTEGVSEFNSKEHEPTQLSKAAAKLGTVASEAAQYRIKIKNSPLLERDAKEVIVEIGGGESWNEVVKWAVKHNLGGIENLSLIPGTVGAAPIQNIGAYGVELKDVFHQLEAFNLTTYETRVFNAEDCRFGYRDSIFKNELKGQYLITKVYLKLTTPQYHTLKLTYGDIQKLLNEKGIKQPTIKQVSDIVTSIRQSKLPDPAVIGNAGSFFKNPEISFAQFDALKAQFPLIVGYPTPNATVKLAAGWLIETAGWKGKRVGAVGIHERQALVLVNYGGGTGADIKQLAAQVQQAVFEKFGVALVAEVNEL
jgi:UDP-N-acetylmuramate dehydrogenase